MDGDLYDFELKQLLDSIPAKYQTIVMQNCYSGGFINELKAPGRTIITACAADECSESFLVKRWGDIFKMKNAYNVFSHMWTSALNGERLDFEYDNTAYYIEGSAPRPVNADFDRNGRVSLEETFISTTQNAEALGYNPDKMLVDLIQMVRMVSNGEEVKMSKRTGNAITIRELCEDVGVDAARWFFVSKELNTQMDFDMDLAKQKNNDNPVYYVQYAYTRMYNILHKEGTPAFEKKDSYTLLTDPKEIALLKQISEFPKKVEDAAKFRAVNRICQYCHDLAKAFHSYYNSCRVSDPSNPELTNERLGLVNACMVTMANALDLIGVSAPEKM